MTTYHTYIGECCREWVLAFGFKVGKCGLCGKRPTHKRTDALCSCETCKEARSNG